MSYISETKQESHAIGFTSLSLLPFTYVYKMQYIFAHEIHKVWITVT